MRTAMIVVNALMTVMITASIAFSAPSGGVQAPPFETLDVDADDVIADSEASAHEQLTTVFAELDLDASGTLSREEYSAFEFVWRQREKTFGS
jgi:hypothetical protein